MFAESYQRCITSHCSFTSTLNLNANYKTIAIAFISVSQWLSFKLWFFVNAEECNEFIKYLTLESMRILEYGYSVSLIVSLIVIVCLHNFLVQNLSEFCSLDEALGLFGLLLQLFIHLLVYDLICLKKVNWDWFIHNYK